MATTQQDGPFYRHADHPEWGCGVVLPAIPGRLDRYDLSFETGGRRILLKSHSSKLVLATVTPQEATALQHKLASKRALGTPVRKKRAAKVAAGPISQDANALPAKAAAKSAKARQAKAEKTEAEAESEVSETVEG
jgi:hypothetical protein